MKPRRIAHHSVARRIKGRAASQLAIHVMVGLAGAAALSWELLWQITASLSLGISALGTAIVLAATMGGMSVGSLVAGRWLTSSSFIPPFRLYGGLELIIGLSGALMLGGFKALEWIDSQIYGISSGLALTVHLLGIVALLGPPTVAMGATVPVYGVMARTYGTSIAVLYGLNTVGATIGVLFMAFIVVPQLGIWTTARCIASLNMIVGVAAMLLPTRAIVSPQTANERRTSVSAAVQMIDWPTAALIVFLTGMATFTLEVAWFRAMRAAFLSTTKSFAIMLAAVLMSLALSAHLAPWLRRRAFNLGPFLLGASIAILLETPLVGRIDLLCTAVRVTTYLQMMLYWFGLSVVSVGPPILLLGVALPWLLEQQREPARWATLYAVNTLGAIVGAVASAWILLPWMGFARTSWMIGVLVGLVTFWRFAGAIRWIAPPALAVSLAFAVSFESGLGRTRVLGMSRPHRVLAYEEGPDATVSVIETIGRRRIRELIIDGCPAASEHEASRYMEWMGRLPVLAHPNPRHALVICLGTGQTANAVLHRRLETLDVVELSPAVFRMAQYFESNAGVLDDPRVQSIVMDGRAWLRRCRREYDVVTLEPMPPYFADSNALYSEDFYRLVALRLSPRGVVSQWVPFHMLPPFYAMSICATFQAVFPNAILWVDPGSGTGILVGRRETSQKLWDWPGLVRTKSRKLERDYVLGGVALDSAGLTRYSKLGTKITDDNQLLSYGDIRRRMFAVGPRATVLNLALVKKAAAESLRTTSSAEAHAKSAQE